MSQLDYFKKALGLYDSHSKECTEKTCELCFSKDFATEEQCSDALSMRPKDPLVIPREICKYPGGECYELAMQVCKEGPTAGNLTLHGLWPQWQNECSGPDLDYDQLSVIMPQLLKKWVSCPEFHNNNKDFWEHEWKKHGTCSGMDQMTFFNKTLELYDAHMSECGEKEDCRICFSKDFQKEDTCSEGPAPSPSPPSPPSPTPTDVCLKNTHGPKCEKDDDCIHIKDCVRCAKSGYCTNVPHDVVFAYV